MFTHSNIKDESLRKSFHKKLFEYFPEIILSAHTVGAKPDMSGYLAAGRSSPMHSNQKSDTIFWMSESINPIRGSWHANFFS